MIQRKRNLRKIRKFRILTIKLMLQLRRFSWISRQFKSLKRSIFSHLELITNSQSHSARSNDSIKAQLDTQIKDMTRSRLWMIKSKVLRILIIWNHFPSVKKRCQKELRIRKSPLCPWSCQSAPRVYRCLHHHLHCHLCKWTSSWRKRPPWSRNRASSKWWTSNSFMKKKKMAMKERYLNKTIINQNKINICKINCSSISPENQPKYRKGYSHQEAKTQSQQMPQIL